MFDDLGYAYEAFFTLSNSRGSNGYGPVAISLTEIKSWLDIAQFADPDDRLDFTKYMQRMDLTWMQYQADERKTIKEQAEKEKKRKAAEDKLQRENKRSNREP